MYLIKQKVVLKLIFYRKANELKCRNILVLNSLPSHIYRIGHYNLLNLIKNTSFLLILFFIGTHILLYINISIPSAVP
jgi:hypothetical protein